MRLLCEFGCLVASGLLVACAHTPAPLPVRSAAATHDYLRDTPDGIVGEQKQVRDGVWCSPDDAFAMPVVPFPNGPTRVIDSYKGWGGQAQVSMLDANESLVQITRTQINPELTEQEALAEVERIARYIGDIEPEVTSEWLLEGGKKQLQQINGAPLYSGAADRIGLEIAQGVSLGFYKSCRVDRHFVGAGYWFQVIAVSYRPLPKETACPIATELASWTVEHMKIGAGCGKRQPYSQHVEPAAR